MGILQARLLGKYLVENNYLKDDDNNVFCASYLNRAQHTCTELLFALNNPNVRNIYFTENRRLEKYQKLLSLETFFSRVALIRIMRKANYNVENIVHRLADFDMNYIVGGRHGSLDKLYGPNYLGCTSKKMNDFLTSYFYGLLAGSISTTTSINTFKSFDNNEIQTKVEDLCIEYNPNLPIQGTGSGIISGMLSGGKKKTRKKKKRYRHKKTYSRRRKTKRKSRRRKKSKK